MSDDLIERLRDHYRTDVGMAAETAADIANAAAALAAKDKAISEMRAENDAFLSDLKAELGRMKLHLSAWEDSARINNARATAAEAQLERATALAELRQRMLDEALLELEAYRAAIPQEEPADLGVGG